MVGNKKQSGFALLVSLIVVGAVLSIGVVIIDLSIKQVRLAATTKDSEIAFHAANAGMECARYWRRQASTTLAVGDSSIDFDCFGETTNVSATTPTYTAGPGGLAYGYEYEFTWNNSQSCTSIKKIIAISDFTTGVQVTNIRTLIPGYPDTILNCPAAGECTVIAAQGFNQPCGQKDDFGTIQREVLLEF